MFTYLLTAFHFSLTDENGSKGRKQHVTDSAHTKNIIYIYRFGFVPDLCPDAVYSGSLGKHHVYSVGVVHLSR